MVFFFGIFLTIGLAAIYFGGVRPLQQLLAAKNWVATPCVVERSGVAVHPSTNGRGNATYSVAVVYHYNFQGFSYTSNRYSFETGSTSGEASKRVIANRYRAGAKATCYVDPSNPADAVIERSPPVSMFIGFGVGALFAAIGGAGIWFGPRLAASAQKASTGVIPQVPPATGELVEIKPQVTPLAKFLGLMAFALIWNGFIGIFVYQLFFSPDHRHAPIAAKLFIGVFVLVGLIILVSAVSGFLALFNPRVSLFTRMPAVALGGEFQFQWKMQGPVERLQKLSIRLEGVESAMHHSGKNNYTVTQCFADIPIVAASDRDIMAEGEARVKIPADLVHSFRAQHNRIVWQLRVRGQIANWPALEENYPIVVVPASSIT